MRAVALAKAAICAVADAGTPTPFVQATQAKLDQAYLVRLSPYKLGTALSPSVRARPIGKFPICSIGGAVGSLAGLVDLFYSDVGLTTPSAGAHADTWFEGRVTQPLALTWALPVAPEGDRRVALEVSGIELINADGALDTAVDRFDIGGRTITVLFGKKGYRYEDFTPIFTGAGVSWSRDFGKLDITARDAGYQLEIPLQAAIYGGTGGDDGTADLANKPKPICVGKVRGIAPQAIDPINLVYQVHSRAIQAVDAVYDKKVALTAGSDHADYDALVAAATASGSYDTCLAAGLIKLGAAPAGIVTADVRGDADDAYVDTTAGIMQRLLSAFGGIALSRLDALGFERFEDAVPGTIGWFQGSDQKITVADAMTALAAHCGAWWGTLPDGRFTVSRIEAPSESAVVEELQAADILDVQIVDPPANTAPPRYRQRVGYQRNWTVLAPADIAGSVSQADVLAAAQPYLVTAALSSQTQADYLLAQDPPVLELLFDAKADADSEAARLVDLLGVQRQAIEVTLNAAGHRIARGGCVAVTTRRINGGARWIGRYIGADIDAARRRVVLTLWG